ncbi:maleate cis-trans isomerase family protein [Rhodococcus artemisiae]|uniref:Maleate cis-trans isomerase n=1 Tax=Rhodococcus artemisiae TaxID=714159 RepID=A0ABU7LB90_9NOCA|nr:maleate cis-trans isomerase [Rhodococcus artemisiae]MEE2058820.1 maleate cis-trans isomerase [Rhodococcus artemisiae]
MVSCPTVGIIYPDHAAEDDYPFAAELLGVRIPVAHIYGTDLHAVPELLDLGSPEKLAAGAAKLEAESPDVVVWACTSGSFVYGPDGARNQVEQLSASAGGIPASSTSFAFVEALRALGATRVAVAASYPRDVSELFVEFLRVAGIDVVSFTGAGIETAAQVGTLTSGEVLDLAAANDHPDAQVLLVPDTAMHTLRFLRDIETHVGKPVLTANQVTVWEGLRLAGYNLGRPELGTLFEEGVDHDTR